MDPQAQPPVSFFAMATDKRNAEKAKVSRPIDQLNECRTALQLSTRVRVLSRQVTYDQGRIDKMMT
jgi:hypothetical protein